jgi:DNA-binding MarR family transcriptional regulator
MPRVPATVPVDDYVLDVLLRDIVGHDRKPAAYLVYLYLYGRAARRRWQAVAAGLGAIAEETGLSRSAVQTAMATLRSRKLILTERAHATATPRHRIQRPWRRN